jgi:hypothetical protein
MRRRMRIRNDVLSKWIKKWGGTGMETSNDAEEQGQVNLDRIVDQTYADFTG